MYHEFVKQDPRAHVVILLLDTSGSMQGSKIGTLNMAVHNMIRAFAQEKNTLVEIKVGIITFGGTASIHQPPTPVSKLVFRDMSADGSTPLGAALGIAKDMIEDRDIIPSRYYRPSVVLVSDGMPTDAYNKNLTEFISTGRSSKCDRFAFGIGGKNELDMSVLEKFLADPERPVFTSAESGSLVNFFKYVTMSTISRSNNADPNTTPDVVKQVEEEAKKIDRFADIDFDALFK